MSRRTGSGPALGAGLPALALALLGAAGPAPARAGEVRLSAELDRDRVVLGETATLRIQLTSDEAPTQVELPSGSPELRVALADRSQSTQVSLDGGGLVMRQVRTWTLSLRPLRKGRFAIPGPIAVVGQARVRHPDLALEAVAAPRPRGPGPSRPPSPAPPDEDPFPREPPGSLSWKGWQRDLLLRVRLDRREAFVGEQVTASLELVSPVPVVGLDAYRPPPLDGFWAEDLKAAGAERIEVVDGVPLRVILVRKLALFPVRAGKASVEPFGLDVRVQIASRDPFGLFPEIRQAQRRSRPVALLVKPLPPGAPPGFQDGNVGAWTLSLAGPEARPAAGQPFPLRLVARGQGNLRALTPPPIPAVPGLRILESAVSDEVKPAGDRFGGARTVETLVALEEPGPLLVPALEWPCFDPRSGKYQLARVPELRLEAGPPLPAPRPSPAESAGLAAQLRPVRTDGALRPPRAPPWRTTWFLAATGSAPLLFAGLALSLRLRDRLARGQGQRRRRRAAGVARRRLARARRRMEAGDATAFHDEVARALLGYAGDRLGLPVAGLTREAIAAGLARAGGGPAAGHFARALEACDSGRFGGPTRMPELLARAEDALARLEESEWRRPGEGA